MASELNADLKKILNADMCIPRNQPLPFFGGGELGGILNKLTEIRYVLSL